MVYFGGSPWNRIHIFHWHLGGSASFGSGGAGGDHKALTGLAFPLLPYVHGIIYREADVYIYIHIQYMYVYVDSTVDMYIYVDM